MSVTEPRDAVKRRNGQQTVDPVNTLAWLGTSSLNTVKRACLAGSLSLGILC